MPRRLLPLLPLALALAITWASHQSTLPGGVSLPHPLDKVAHGTAFALLGALTGWGWGRGWPRWRWSLLLGVLALFGAADEWHQAFVPGRDCSLGDWAADAFGAAVGLGLARRLGRDRGRPESRLEPRP
jgi:VanZ family protein